MNRRMVRRLVETQRPSRRGWTAVDWRRWARRLVACCLAMLLGVWVMHRWPGEAWWGGIVVIYAPRALWLAPACLALLVGILARDSLSVAAGLVATAAVVGFMQPQLHPLAGPQSADSFIIATLNTHNQWRNAARARAAVDVLRADIVVTQEAIDKRFLPHFSGFECVRNRGQRIFVRQRRLPLPGTETEAVPDGGAGPVIIADRPTRLADGWRPAHEAQMVVAGHRLSLLDVHLVLDYDASIPNRIAVRSRPYLYRTVKLRRNQIAYIARWAQQQQEPFIIAGDFNTPPDVAPWQPLLPLAADAFAQRGSGLGYTYNRRLPLWRIDYLWVSPQLRVLRCGTFDAGMSDHLGVWAELEFAR